MIRTALTLSFALGLLACGAPSADRATPAPTPAPAALTEVELRVDGASSSIAWMAVKNGSAEVKGTFTGLDGSLNVPGGDLSKATGAVAIDFSTVASGDPGRDVNLRSVFFDADDEGANQGRVTLTGLTFADGGAGPAVGGAAKATASVSVSAGLAFLDVTVPVLVSRPTPGVVSLSVEGTVGVGLEALGMSERTAALIAACAHESIGDSVSISGSITFGSN